MVADFFVGITVQQSGILCTHDLDVCPAAMSGLGRTGGLLPFGVAVQKNVYIRLFVLGERSFSGGSLTFAKANAYGGMEMSRQVVFAWHGKRIVIKKFFILSFWWFCPIMMGGKGVSLQ